MLSKHYYLLFSRNPFNLFFNAISNLQLLSLSPAKTSDCAIQMEHSYSRDKRPTDNTMATRTILVHKPPPCPSCHSAAGPENDIDMDEESIPLLPLPEIDEPVAREAMDVIGNIASKTKNRNSEDEDWEEAVDRTGWTIYQQTLFAKVAEILACDRLARLTQCNHPSEPILRRANIDKAVSRMRKAMAIIHWDTKLSQWLHGLLVDHLPISYMTAYMDILQTLRAKLPTLVDKMLQGRSNELLEAVVKPPWQPITEAKDRKIASDPILLLCPSTFTNNSSGGTNATREQYWTSLFTTMSNSVRTVTVPEAFFPENLSLSDCLESLVTLTRTRLHELRKEMPQKSVILVGFNAGSAVALQVAGLENNLSCVVCMGFATNTLRGTRGSLDDRLVELQTPVLFVVGQNGMRTSQEQIEALREQMIAPTALVVVGSANDSLQVNYAKRRLEQVTQSMVDSMIMDEVAEFTANCIANPPQAMKRKLPGAPKLVVLNSPQKGGGATMTTDGVTMPIAAVVPKKPKMGVSASESLGSVKAGGVKVGRLLKKKEMFQRSGVAHKLSPTKTEYADKVGLTTPGATSYEIVTGRLKQDTNVRQIVDSGFIQIASEGAVSKWQLTRQGNGVNGSGGNTSAIMPIVQKHKISLGNQFTPMRTTGERMLASGSSSGTKLPNGLYTLKSSTMAGGEAPTLLETIELDTDEEIINLDDVQVIDAAQVINGTEFTARDMAEIPVVFQDSEGNLQDPLAKSESFGGQVVISANSTMPITEASVVVSAQTVIPPRPNKFIYYKPKQGGTQFINTATITPSNGGGGGGMGISSKPMIISVESIDKDAPSTVYHVVPDVEE